MRGSSLSYTRRVSRGLLRLAALTLIAGCHEDLTLVDEEVPAADAAVVVLDAAETMLDAAAPKDAGPALPDAAIDEDGGTLGDGGAAPDAGDDPDPGNSCVWDGDPFDPAALEAEVTYLASDQLEGRAPETPGDIAARTQIEDRFRCLGLTSAQPDGTYQQPFVTSDGRNTANVVAYVPGSDPAVADDLLVVGAHHDHLGVRRGQIYNGANDNASGVAAVLAVAQALRQRAVPLRRTVVFITFGFEEHVGECEGSKYYVAHAPAALPIDRVVYMINLDMVGTYQYHDLSAYGAYAGTPGRTTLESLLVSHPELTFDLDAEADVDDSDFQAFCNQGVPYVYFETWDDDCYHSACDDAGRLDYGHMAEIADLATELIVALADGTTDLAAARAQIGCLGP